MILVLNDRKRRMKFIRIIEKKDLRADQDTGNSVQELDYPTEENKRLFIQESFKIDENDEKLNEEVIKMFHKNFSALALHPNYYGKTDILELKIEIEAGSRVRPLNPDQRANLKDHLDEWIQQGVIKPAHSPWASP